MSDFKKEDLRIMNDLIEITDENAVLKWHGFTWALEYLASKDNYRKGNYDLSNLSIDEKRRVLDYMKAATNLPDVPASSAVSDECISVCLEKLEQNLLAHRKQKLYELEKIDARYSTDGRYLLMSKYFEEEDLPWLQLSQIVRSEIEKGIHTDLAPCVDTFKKDEDDFDAYVKKKQQDTAVQVLRQRLMKKQLGSEDEIVNCTGLSEEIVKILVEECSIRQQINLKLDEIYDYKVINGIQEWIYLLYMAEKDFDEITYLTGVSANTAEEWYNDAEKEIIWLADRRYYTLEQASQLFSMPHDLAKEYYEEIKKDGGIWKYYPYQPNCLSERKASDSFYKEMYQKYLKI